MEMRVRYGMKPQRVVKDAVVPSKVELVPAEKERLK